MERTPHQGGETPRTPEQGELLRINTIVIPAGDRQPLRLDQVNPTSLGDYQQLVGGHIETVPLDDPPTNMYLNEEGKLDQLPINARATLLLWMHNKAFRYNDYIAGDAFLTGPINEDSTDTSVSADLVRMLTEAGQFRVELQTAGDPEWYGNLRRFDAWTDAYAYALTLGQHWSQVEDMRVVPEDPAE